MTTAAAATAHSTGDLHGTLVGGQGEASRWPDRWDVAVFLVGFALVLALAELLIARVGLIGDEPWYLLQVEGLIRVHSVNVAPLMNDHAFYAHAFGKQPDDHTADYLGNGERVLFYMPGYAAILAPFYQLGGRGLVVAFQALVAALTGALVFAEARRLFGGHTVALLAWLAYLIALPVLLYAGQIFPSTLASCAMMGGYTLAVRALPAARGRRLVALGIATGLIVFILPWLHVRYLLPALVLAGLALLALRARLRRRPLAGADRAASSSAWYATAAVVGLTALSLLLIGLYCRHYFGTWMPPNGREAASFTNPNFAKALSLYGRMFLDPRSGVLPWVPLDLLALPGLVLLLRRVPWAGRALAALLAAQLVTYFSAAISPVFQGDAFIGRFTLECAPFFALCIGAVFAAGRLAVATAPEGLVATKPDYAGWGGTEGVSRVPFARVIAARVRAGVALLTAPGMPRALARPRPEGVADAVWPGGPRALRWLTWQRVALVGLLLLVATIWFALVGELDPVLLRPPNVQVVPLLARFPHLLPGPLFALFPWV